MAVCLQPCATCKDVPTTSRLFWSVLPPQPIDVLASRILALQAGGAKRAASEASASEKDDGTSVGDGTSIGGASDVRGTGTRAG